MTAPARPGRPQVVVLSHATDRTGPPMWLRDMLRHLPADDLDLVVVSMRGGPLLAEIAARASVRVVGEAHLDAATADPVAEVEAERRAALADLRPDLVLVNTAWSANALDWLPEGPRPIVSFVHELDDGLDRLRSDRLAAFLGADLVATGCRAVADLVAARGVPPDRLRLVPYGIDDPGDRSGASDPVPPIALGARSGDVVVVAAAVFEHRKGPDLFVHLAARAVARHPGVPWHFTWIGATGGTDLHREVVADAVRLGVVDRVTFVPPTKALRSYLRAADSFALVSREDAFPLVALEAGAAGLPVVAFDRTGLGELLDHGGGRIVAYPDLDSMADVLAGWAAEPAVAHQVGEAGRTEVVDHRDVRTGARVLRAVLDEALEIRFR